METTNDPGSKENSQLSQTSDSSKVKIFLYFIIIFYLLKMFLFCVMLVCYCTVCQKKKKEKKKKHPYLFQYKLSEEMKLVSIIKDFYLLQFDALNLFRGVST